MAQINFTLDYDFFIGLLKESKEYAYAKLMESMLNQILKAESEEQLGALVSSPFPQLWYSSEAFTTSVFVA
jgi:hypothetical protein